MSNQNSRLCVVLLNYRTPDMVEDCLDTLFPQSLAVGAKVVVVDNCSNDDSVDRIQNWIDRNSAGAVVELLASDINGGFAAGNNLGIKAKLADQYLLINSDTLLRENALAEMLTTMQADDRLGLVSPRLEWPDEAPQESCFRYHRPLSQLIASANTGFILKLFKRYEVAHRVASSDAEYEWTSFACVMIRKPVLDQIGLLDDKFFMYFEDVDFCYRARQAGWLIRNHPAARVVHLRGGSSPVKANKIQRKRQAKYFYESRTRYFYKIYGRIGLLGANLCWTAGWMFANARALVDRNFVVPACQLEWKDIWTNFRNPNRDYIHPQNYASNKSSTS